MSKQIVVFIVSNILPYSHEINSIIGVPTGFFYRLRYTEAWSSVKDIRKYLGEEGLIVMRVVEDGNLIPIRKIKLMDILKVGDILYFSIQLLELVEFSSDETKRKHQIEKFTGQLNQEMDWHNLPGEYLTKSILLSADHTHSINDEADLGDPQNKEVNSWGNITKHMSSLEVFNDFDFLKIINITDEKAKPVDIISTQGSLRYRLASNRIYRLSVLQRTYIKDPRQSKVGYKREIQLLCIESDTQAIKTTFSITGKYDLYEFVFKTNKDLINKNSFVILQTKPIDTLNEPDFYNPPIHIPINIFATRKWLILQTIGLVIFITSVIFLFFTNQIFTDFGITLSPENIQSIQNASILLMVLTSTFLGKLTNYLFSSIGLPIQVEMPNK